MLLCDIGNTSYHFLDDEKDYKESVKEFNPLDVKAKVFYICVNPKISLILKSQENWIDLAEYVDMKNYYSTMGIDRIFACEAVVNAVVVDAGSAITVDVVKSGLFEGGFIYPGVNAMSEAYSSISSRLDYSFNFDIDLSKLPKNSQDSITYGYLGAFYKEVVSYGMEIYLTGGDAQYLSQIFPSARVDSSLVFNGMKKVLAQSRA